MPFEQTAVARSVAAVVGVGVPPSNALLVQPRPVQVSMAPPKLALVSNGSASVALGACGLAAVGVVRKVDRSNTVQPLSGSRRGTVSGESGAAVHAPSRGPQRGAQGDLSRLALNPTHRPVPKRNDGTKQRKGGYDSSKRDGKTFAALPTMVLESEQYAALSAPAVKLLVDLAAQHKGYYNGDLCAAWSVMVKRGWRSRDTLARALRELINAGFVVQTRQGGRNAASLYAVTFYDLDRSAKLDMLARDFPRGKWLRTPAGAGGRPGS